MAIPSPTLSTWQDDLSPLAPSLRSPVYSLTSPVHSILSPPRVLATPDWARRTVPNAAPFPHPLGAHYANSLEGWAYSRPPLASPPRPLPHIKRLPRFTPPMRHARIGGIYSEHPRFDDRVHHFTRQVFDVSDNVQSIHIQSQIDYQFSEAAGRVLDDAYEYGKVRTEESILEAEREFITRLQSHSKHVVDGEMNEHAQRLVQRREAMFSSDLALISSSLARATREVRACERRIQIGRETLEVEYNRSHDRRPSPPLYQILTSRINGLYDIFRRIEDIGPCHNDDHAAHHIPSPVVPAGPSYPISHRLPRLSDLTGPSKCTLPIPLPSYSRIPAARAANDIPYTALGYRQPALTPPLGKVLPAPERAWHLAPVESGAAMPQSHEDDGTRGRATTVGGRPNPATIAVAVSARLQFNSPYQQPKPKRTPVQPGFTKDVILERRSYEQHQRDFTLAPAPVNPRWRSRTNTPQRRPRRLSDGTCASEEPGEPTVRFNSGAFPTTQVYFPMLDEDDEAPVQGNGEAMRHIIDASRRRDQLDGYVSAVGVNVLPSPSRSPSAPSSIASRRQSVPLQRHDGRLGPYSHPPLAMTSLTSDDEQSPKLKRARDESVEIDGLVPALPPKKVAKATRAWQRHPRRSSSPLALVKVETPDTP